MFAVSGTVVGIVIRYGLDDPRFELACGLDFPPAYQTGSRSILKRSALQLQ